MTQKARIGHRVRYAYDWGLVSPQWAGQMAEGEGYVERVVVSARNGKRWVLLDDGQWIAESDIVETFDYEVEE